MYGTTMIGKLAAGATGEDANQLLKAWIAERPVPGFKSAHLMVSDDGTTIVNVAVFESEAAYKALADDPAQDEWWRTKMAPMLDGEPQWIDGSWIA